MGRGEREVMWEIVDQRPVSGGCKVEGFSTMMKSKVDQKVEGVDGEMGDLS